MKLIDTHIHIWDLEAVVYLWLQGDRSILGRNYALEELDMVRRKVGVSAGVLVQAANTLEETEFMLRAAAASDWIKGVVGWLPLEKPEVTAELLEGKWRTEGLLKGVRHLIHDEADPEWLLQQPVLESLELLAARGIPYDVVGIQPAHIRTALKVAEKIPGLRMVFDHLNQPPIARPQRGSEWEKLMKEAASHASFFVKISGLGTTAGKGEEWRVEDIEPCIEFVLYYFGADRCFCGGDWPVSLLAGSYEKVWGAYRSVIEKYLDTGAQEKVFYQSAARFYGIGND